MEAVESTVVLWVDEYQWHVLLPGLADSSTSPAPQRLTEVVTLVGMDTAGYHWAVTGTRDDSVPELASYVLT